jgi:hypothetical protein
VVLLTQHQQQYEHVQQHAIRGIRLAGVSAAFDWCSVGGCFERSAWFTCELSVFLPVKSAAAAAANSDTAWAAVRSANNSTATDSATTDSTADSAADSA